MEENLRQCHKPYTSKDKWIVSIMSGLLFILIASPFLYDIINSVSVQLTNFQIATDGRPNLAGLILHGIIFIIIVRLLMR